VLFITIIFINIIIVIVMLFQLVKVVNLSTRNALK